MTGRSGHTDSTDYQGRGTTTGNSEALRFDKALFRRHPEFRGALKARVVGPGVMLVVAQEPPAESAAEDAADPMLAAWLSFIEADARQLRDLSEERLAEMGELVAGVTVGDDDDLDGASF